LCELGLSIAEEPPESIPDSMQFSLNFIDEDQDEEYCTAEERHIDTVGNVLIRSIKLPFLG